MRPQFRSDLIKNILRPLVALHTLFAGVLVWQETNHLEIETQVLAISVYLVLAIATFLDGRTYMKWALLVNVLTVLYLVGIA